MKRFFTILAVVVAFFAVSNVVRAQSDPRNGTWKLNVAKSTFGSGPASKGETRTYVANGDSIKATIDRVNADGATQSYGYNAKYDGKDYPLTGKAPLGAETISVKRINANTMDATVKKAGKILFTGRAIVSKDGKVLTLTIKGATAKDQQSSNVAVYEKQ
jgi:hypothetical protein